jgi:hypothetical protein
MKLSFNIALWFDCNSGVDCRADPTLGKENWIGTGHGGPDGVTRRSFGGYYKDAARLRRDISVVFHFT